MTFAPRGGARAGDAAGPDLRRGDGQAIACGLHRLIYTSEAWSPGDPEDGPHTSVQEIAADAAARNAMRGLSGVLVAVRGHFIQILEGEVEMLETVFERICRDMRHRALTLVDYSPAAERHFEDWAMVPLDANLMENSEPFEDLFMSIRSGMAPATIIREVRGFLDILSPERPGTGTASG